jgi:ubiquitin C-terminal hydrolase
MDKIFKIPSKDTNNQLLQQNGICGLQNIGNTCYLNSVIQCIRYDKYLFEYFKDNYHTRHLNTGSPINIAFVEAWRQLLLDFWGNNKLIIQPVGFFGTFQKICYYKKKTELIGFNHNDAEEFLQFFLENLHDGIKITIPASKMVIKGEIKTLTDQLMSDYCKFCETHYDKNGISPISNQYEGIYCSSITNSVDKKSSNKFEPFLYVNLEINDLNENDSIFQSLESFTNPEQLTDFKDADYQLDTTFNKQVRFLKLPNNLTIVLKRFKFNMETMKPYKIDISLKFPTTLDMSPFTIGYANKYTQYELYAICNHQGNLDHGHYYSFVKNFNNEWVLFNDRNFKEISKDMMDREQLFSKDAYILFYRLIQQ